MVWKYFSIYTKFNGYIYEVVEFILAGVNLRD